MKKLMIFGVVIILLIALVIAPDFTGFTLYEHYLNGDDEDHSLPTAGARIVMQSFTVGNVGANVTFVPRGIGVRTTQFVGDGVDYYWNIYASNSSGVPNDLGAGLCDNVLVDTGSNYTIAGNNTYNHSLTGCTALSPDGNYTIALWTSNGSAGNNALWKLDTASSYTGGQRIISEDNGSTYDITSGHDYIFAIYGIPGIGVMNLNYPTNNSLFTNSSIAFNVSVTNLTTNLVNFTLYIDNVVNETIDVSGTENETIFNKSVAEGDHNWTFQACNDADECSFGENRTFSIRDFAVKNESFANSTIEGSVETFQINVSTNALQISTADLVYNDTNYSGTITDNGNYNYTLATSLTVPGVSADQNVTFQWNITLENSNDFNSTTNNQTIQNMGIDNCTSFSELILNYTVRDEELQTQLNGATDLVNVKIDVSISAVGSTTTLINFSEDINGTNPAQVCLELDLNASEYRMDVQTRYSSSDRVVEYHHIQNFSLTNETVPQNIDLYDLATTDSQEFRITFQDVNFIPVENALIDIQRKYVEDGVFRSVEIPRTDSDGETVGHFVLSDIIYNIIVTREGETLATFENIIAFCDNVATGECYISLQQSATETIPEDFTQFRNLVFNMTFNQDTRTITTIFSTLDGSTSTVLINATLFNMFGNQSVCSDSLTSSAGTLTCAVPQSYGNATVVAELFVDNRLAITNIYTIEPDIRETFAGVRGMLAIILLMILPMMFVTSTVGIVIGSILGIILASMLFLISKGSLLGQASIVVWAIIAGMIIVWKISRRSG